MASLPRNLVTLQSLHIRLMPSRLFSPAVCFVFIKWNFVLLDLILVIYIEQSSCFSNILLKVLL